MKKFPLVSIQDDATLKKALGFVDHIMQGGELDSGAESYLDALADLIGVFEEKHYKFPAVTLPELLEHLMQARKVNQSQLADSTGIPRSTISEILRGKRTLSLGHIGPLSKYFRVPASVLLTEDVLVRV